VIQRSRSIALTLLCACFAVQGCTSVKKTFGFDRDAPNEFAVTPGNAPLEMPPDFFYLPTPEPGMERPQDRAAREAQVGKFLGAAQEKEEASAGQKHLLEMSGAEANQDKVRYEIDEVAHMDVNKDATVIEKLGLKKEKPLGEAVNPYEERERLHEQQRPSATDQVMPSSQQPQSRQRQGDGQTPENLPPIAPEENLGNLSQ